MTIDFSTPRPVLVDSEPRALHAADPFALVFERSPVGVAIGRPGGEIVYVNETMCRLLGVARENVTVASFIGAAHPEHKSRVRVIAEGVETGDQLDRIRRAGCETATGNFLAPASTAETITERLTDPSPA